MTTIARLAVEKLRSNFPDAVLEVSEFRGQTLVRVRKEDLVPVMGFLRDDPELKYNMLTNLCGVDWIGEEERFEVVYHLLSLPNRDRLTIKVRATEDDPTVPSITSVWPTANWHEREVYDLFGVVFEGHPDLRRILMPADWEGHPLRKDYDLGYETVAFTHNQDQVYERKPFARG